MTDSSTMMTGRDDRPARGGHGPSSVRAAPIASGLEVEGLSERARANATGLARPSSKPASSSRQRCGRRSAPGKRRNMSQRAVLMIRSHQEEHTKWKGRERQHAGGAFVFREGPFPTLSDNNLAGVLVQWFAPP